VTLPFIIFDSSLAEVSRTIGVWLLCASRVLPLALFVPIFCGLPGSRWSRVGFAMVLGVCLSLLLGLVHVPSTLPIEDLTYVQFLLAAMGECLVGAMLTLPIVIGFAAINAAMSGLWIMAGETRSIRDDDPTPDPLAALVWVVAAAVLVSSGGLRFMVQGLAQSFQDVAIGAVGNASRFNPTSGVLQSFAVTSESVIDIAGQLFLSTLLIAGPMYLTLILVEVALIVLTRIAGRMDGATTGKAIKPIILTLAAALTLTAVVAAIGQFTGILAA